MQTFTTVVLLLAMGLLSGCSTSPTGRRQTQVVPDSQMSSMGDQAWAEMKSKIPPSTDQASQAFAEKVAKRLIDVSGASDQKWDVAVFQSDEVNAFALPGGHIGVFNGILPVAENEAGLATVLSHEVAHVLARHSGERASQQLIAQGALSTASAAFGSGQFHDPLMAALGLGAQVGIILPFSRAQEAEADELGFLMMAKAGYDPNEALTFWTRMSERSQGGPPTMLSEHPATSDRIAKLKELLPKASEEYSKTASRLGAGSRVPASSARR